MQLITQLRCDQYWILKPMMIFTCGGGFLGKFSKEIEWTNKILPWGTQFWVIFQFHLVAKNLNWVPHCKNWFGHSNSFERAIFQTFLKLHCFTKSLFFELETSNCGYLLIFWFPFTVQSFSRIGKALIGWWLKSPAIFRIQISQGFFFVLTNFERWLPSLFQVSRICTLGKDLSREKICHCQMKR